MARGSEQKYTLKFGASKPFMKRTQHFAVKIGEEMT